MKLVEWIKKNKLATLLLLVVVFFLFRNFLGVSLLSIPNQSSMTYDSYGGDGLAGAPQMTLPTLGSTANSKISLPSIQPPDYAPTPDVANRIVIQESNLSLLVKDVLSARNQILNYTSKAGGYMVNSSTSNPQDAPTSAITIRVPASKLQESLDYFHSLSVKVVSENLIGTDVTDQYVDIDTRLKQLETTKKRFEDILSQATKIEDITNLTNQILSYQSQIDSYKGQQDSLAKNAQLAKLTIYLSTDEIALPYASTDTFRPAVIFKLAVRSLVSSLRQLATTAIWLVVYAVIWLPALIIFVLVRKWWLNKKVKKN